MSTEPDSSALHRMVSVAHRLEARHFALATTSFAPHVVAQARRDPDLRRDLVRLRDLLRPHAFVDAASRDAACRVLMLGSFELAPTTADGLGVILGSECLVAVGHGIGHPGFAVVAPAIVDPEIGGLVERLSPSALLDDDAVDPTVVTIAGVHYKLSVDPFDLEAQVEAKSPFDAADDDEVLATARWLYDRLDARLEREVR